MQTKEEILALLEQFEQAGVRQGALAVNKLMELMKRKKEENALFNKAKLRH
jgi:hypothetical protein